jgi:hypothetical protein
MGVAHIIPKLDHFVLKQQETTIGTWVPPVKETPICLVQQIGKCSGGRMQKVFETGV